MQATKNRLSGRLGESGHEGGREDWSRPRSLHQERKDQDDCIDRSREGHLHLANLDCDLQLHG